VGDDGESWIRNEGICPSLQTLHETNLHIGISGLSGYQRKKSKEVWYEELEIQRPRFLSFREQGNKDAANSIRFHTSATMTASMSSANLAVASWAVTRKRINNGREQCAGATRRERHGAKKEKEKENEKKKPRVRKACVYATISCMTRARILFGHFCVRSFPSFLPTFEL